MRCDVSQYCKTCHTCQVAGKPHQKQCCNLDTLKNCHVRADVDPVCVVLVDVHSTESDVTVTVDREFCDFCRNVPVWRRILICLLIWVRSYLIGWMLKSLHYLIVLHE